MMKYSGKGGNQTKEKTDRKGIYNPIGGHVEQGEDVLQSAAREAMEEAGVTLIHPKIKGIINISGFAGKDIVNFIVTATTKDSVLDSTLEGELNWVDIDKVGQFNIFADIKPILNNLLSMNENEMFVGVAKFEGFKLKNIFMRVV